MGYHILAQLFDKKDPPTYAYDCAKIVDIKRRLRASIPPICAYDSPRIIAIEYHSSSVNKGAPTQSTAPTPIHSHHYDSTNKQSPEYEYGPFGELIRATSEKKDDFSFRFSTKYEDAETGLLYYGFRYYDPSTGRWLSRDPIAENGGLNLYAYVGNNPINLWDPLGLKCRMAPGRKKIMERTPTYWDYFNGWRAAKFARKSASERYPTISQHNTRADAFRHAVWNAEMTRYMGPVRAEVIATAHEDHPNNNSREKAMDLNNNEVGRDVATENPDLNREDLEREVYKKACDSGLQDTP